MTDFHVPDSDMPNFPWPGRRDASAEDAALAAMLSNSGEPEALSASLRPAADVLAALRARPSGDELAGLPAAMAEFRARIGVSDRPLPTRRRRHSVLGPILSAKAAAAAAAVVVVIGGVATAAYAGALPGTFQTAAHRMIGAPAEHHAAGSASPSPSSTAAKKAAHRRRHHARHFFCVPAPHPSKSASPSPSMSTSPATSASPSPSASPTKRPKRHFPTCVVCPKPTTSASPSPSTSSSSSASTSSKHVTYCQPFPHPAKKPRAHKQHQKPVKFRKHHARKRSVRKPFPHPTHSPQPQPSPSASTSPAMN